MTDVDVKTYNDDACLGATCPSLELLEFARGEKMDLQPGKVHVLYFFVSYYKGAWVINEEMTQLIEKTKDVNFIAISNDVDMASVEKFLTKIADGRVNDVNTGAIYRLGFPSITYDDKKATAKLMAELSKGAILHVPTAFIIGKDGKIAWKQAMTQSFTLAQSNFADQLDRVLKGEALDMTNGDKPKVEVEEGEDAECDDMALF